MTTAISRKSKRHSLIESWRTFIYRHVVWLMSDNKPVETSVELRAKLAEKHPIAPADRSFSSPSLLFQFHLVLLEVTAISRLNQYSWRWSRTAFGIDHVRQHAAEWSMSSKDCSMLFGGRLIALIKACDGIRPILVGYMLRLVTSKCASATVLIMLSDYLAPQQLGLGVLPGGMRNRHSCY